MLRKQLLILLTALASLTIATAYAAPVTLITSAPYAITAPGKYALANDISYPYGAIRISASDVTLDLGGHTITSGGGISISSPDGTPLTNVRVSNGAIVPSNVVSTNTLPVSIAKGSYCTLSGLTITVPSILTTGYPYGIYISGGGFNRITNCVLIGISPTATIPQTAGTAIQAAQTSNNIFQNIVFKGTFTHTYVEDDQAQYNLPVTALGNNTWAGNSFANPTQ